MAATATKTRTRTRAASSSKKSATAGGNGSSKKATKAAVKAATKKSPEASKAATKKATGRKAAEASADEDQQAKDEAKAKAREEARQAAEAKANEERQAAIDSGELYVDEANDREFWLSTKVEDALEANDEDALPVVYTKARDIIDALKASDMPLRKRDIAQPNIMSVGIFSTLRVLGLIEEYRVRSTTGTRGEAGVAYRWVGEEDEGEE